MSRLGPVVWLTGLSGAGKTTIADAFEERLTQEGIRAARLDGDDLRNGLNQDLGFTTQDRSENLRRAAHVARLLSRTGDVVICSFISPALEDRRRIREIVGDRYVEVFVSTSLRECERRDPKGLYKRARAGELRNFTGISADYEEPENPELVLDTEALTIEGAVDRLLNYIKSGSR